MLIKNAHVLSPHVTEGFYDIRVLDGKIAEVGESLSAEGESVRDAGGAYVTPDSLMPTHILDSKQIRWVNFTLIIMRRR